MSISLDKKTGINLTKGSKISLEKNGKHLENVCIGLNWGSIKKKLFNFIPLENISVDLDGSVSTFDAEGKEIDTIYYYNLRSKDGAIKHSGDDLSGDKGEDDGLDNEVITINLAKVNPNIQTIIFFLSSYRGQDFSIIPYSKIRIFEGTPKEVREVMATMNLSAEPAFAGFTAMVMGKLVRKGSGWDFNAIGQPIKAADINDAVKAIQREFIK